jgi:hypothetical protein
MMPLQSVAVLSQAEVLSLVRWQPFDIPDRAEFVRD